MISRHLGLFFFHVCTMLLAQEGVLSYLSEKLKINAGKPLRQSSQEISQTFLMLEFCYLKKGK